MRTGTSPLAATISIAAVVVSGTWAANHAAAEGAESVTWPQWRGPSRDGRCAGPTWPTDLGPERLVKLWRVGDLGPSYCGAIVTEHRVFSFETRDEQDEVVRAFDRATGTELWTTKWAGSMDVPFFAARNGSWVRSTPTWDGERLYVGGMQDVLVCIDGGTGEQVWTVDFKETLGTPDPSFGLVCSPLVVGGHVFLQAGGSLVKLDKRTGEVVWRALEDGGAMNSAFSSPVVAELSGQRQVVVLTRQKMCGVDPVSGDLLWEQTIKSFRGMNILTPVVHGDAVLTAPYGGRTQLLAIGGREEAFEVTQLWNNKLQGYMTSPVIVGDHAYFFTRSNRFACVDLNTGEPAWISGPTGDNYWSLAAQGDRILALNDTGMLRLIRATPEAYEVIDEATVADDKTWAHVAVAGREIFIREEHGLVAYRWE